MRIVTRADFDGIICATLLQEALETTEPIFWVEPGDMQKGLVTIQEGDILANLPYDERCAMWFDHHYTNRPDTPFEGSFEIAPSAAGVVFRYYRDRFGRDYTELVRQTDKIDSADLTPDEVIHPENYPYILLSMTISGRRKEDESYWNRLIRLLGKYDMSRVIEDAEIRERCQTVTEQNIRYRKFLKNHTRLEKHVSDSVP